LSAGNYTLLAMAHGASGETLAEVYDLDAPPSDSSASRMINLSTLQQLSSANPAVTAGLVVGGSNARQLLIRGVGPGLAAFGVATPLPDPVLAVFTGSRVIASMTPTLYNQQQVAAASTITATATGVGAFAASSEDAAVLVTLPPGAYTVQVSSRSQNSGSVLIELYEVP
jgi:hypothetical protein